MSKKKILREILNEVDKHPEIMSRRQALKYLAVSPLAASMLAGTSAGATDAMASVDVKGKIVIVGGGLAGMSTAARLNNTIANADITVIEPDPLSVSYQPGQTLIAGGVWTIDDILYNRDDFVPNGVKLVTKAVTAFDPDNNKVIVDGKEEITYDQLIIATGASLMYSNIKGLEGNITSTTKDNAATKKTITQNGLHSIYFQDGAVATWAGIQELIEKAKKHTGAEKLKAIFTHPNTPIKCGGAPMKIMYITHDRLKEAGVADKVELTFNTDGGVLFGIPEYNTAVVAQFEARGFKHNFKHNLIEVDTANKVAVFDKWKEEKKFNEETEEEETIKTSERVEMKYDFMHVTPPMNVGEVVANSKISNGKWVTVEQKTLQHMDFKNVWSLGDAAGMPMAKTGGSARKEYKVVVDNMVAAMEKKPLTAEYDGYTVCPLITSIGTVMLAEFNWTKKPTPSFPLDPTQERWIWWLLKVYLLKPMTMYGMLSGRA